MGVQSFHRMYQYWGICMKIKLYVKMWCIKSYHMAQVEATIKAWWKVCLQRYRHALRNDNKSWHHFGNSVSDHVIILKIPPIPIIDFHKANHSERNNVSIFVCVPDLIPWHVFHNNWLFGIINSKVISDGHYPCIKYINYNLFA